MPVKDLIKSIDFENSFSQNELKRRTKKPGGWSRGINAPKPSPSSKGAFKKVHSARKIEVFGSICEKLGTLAQRARKTSNPSSFDSQIAQYLEIFKSLKYSERKILTQALKKVANLKAVDSATDTLVNAIAGKSFSRQEQIQLEIETLSRHFQHRRQLLESSFTEIQVAKLLGASPQTLHDRIGNQTLLAIMDNGKLCFPSWQFDPAGSDGVIDALPDVLKALAISDYVKLNWLTRINPYLDSQTPIQALKAGQKERVLAEASAVGAGQWS
jgi:hypothetical protein